MINMVKIMNIQMQIMIVTQFKPETYKIDSKTKEHNRRLIADLDKYVLD